MSPTEKSFQVTSCQLSGQFWNEHADRLCVALHGWLDNSASFTPLAPLLKHTALLALDMAGHGRSGHRPAGSVYHYLDNVFDVLQVLRQVTPQQTVLLGHSMGAGVACLAAATAPELVQGLILIEGLGPLSQAETEIVHQMRKSWKHYADWAGKRKPVYSNKQQAIQVRMEMGQLEESAASLLVERGLEPVEGGFIWSSDFRLRHPSMVQLSEPQVQAFLREIKCPVLLIAAKQGMRTHQELMRQRIACIDKLTFKELPGGHHLHMQHPQLVADCVNEFIENQR